VFRYIGVLRRYAWIVVLLTALSAGSTILFTLREPKIYEATATLLINPAAPNQAIAYSSQLISSGGYSPGGALQRLADTYTAYLTSDAFGRIALRQLNLPVSPIGQISTDLVGDTNFYRINVTGRDPQQVERIANGVATLFITQNVQLQAQGQNTAGSKLSNLVSQLTNRLNALSTQELALTAKTSKASQAELQVLDARIASLSVALNNLQQNSTQTSQSLNTATLVGPAVVPTLPISPSLRKNVIFGTMAGLVIGLLLAFLLDYMDYSVRSPEDVETLTGQMPLAVISLASGRRAGAPGSVQVPGIASTVFALQNPRDGTSEAFRALRTNLAFSALDRQLRTLVITSVSPGEGKSTVAANLAVVMAQSGKRVILIDADLRRPSVHKLFGLSNIAGFTDLLLTRDTGLSGLQATVVPNLRVLTSGPLPPNPAELLTSEAALPLIEALKEQSDLVIFDTPPMGALTDAVVLSARTDGTMLVVRAGTTRPPVVSKALETLRKVGGHPLGVVLNMVDVRSLRDYSYYYYYGNYRYYGEKAADQRKGATGVAGEA
jgi:non-specific protein-tyrosine kinase